MLTLNSYIFCYIGKPILKWHIIMSTLQNYVIFTICQYNILCHFNISFFTVYNMVNMLKTQLINLYITRLRRCIHHHACMHACTHTHTHTHTTHTQHTHNTHTHNTHTHIQSHMCGHNVHNVQPVDRSVLVLYQPQTSVDQHNRMY